MGRIYLGKNSYYKIPTDGLTKTQKAIINACAQLMDFLDGKTVVWNSKTKRYNIAKFTYSQGKGFRFVSFVARIFTIKRYAPKPVYSDLDFIQHLAYQYSKRSISKRKIIEAIKKLLRNYNIPKKIIEKILKIK